jgi:hypothetical protein
MLLPHIFHPISFARYTRVIQCIVKVTVHLQNVLDWYPWAFIQAWTCLILFTNTFCRSAFGKSLCTYKRCWKWCPWASLQAWTIAWAHSNFPNTLYNHKFLFVRSYHAPRNQIDSGGWKQWVPLCQTTLTRPSMKSGTVPRSWPSTRI